MIETRMIKDSAIAWAIQALAGLLLLLAAGCGASSTAPAPSATAQPPTPVPPAASLWPPTVAPPTPVATATTPPPTVAPTPVPPTTTPLPTPAPTPVPTATLPLPPVAALTPGATPGPGAANSLSFMVEQARPSVVRIQHSGLSAGSGVVIAVDGDTGYLVTNSHVVQGLESVKVIVNDAQVYAGRVEGMDEIHDLAVVSICCGEFQALSFGSIDDLRPGDDVVAIGYAMGLEGMATITRGIVSAIRYDPLVQSEVIQTDAVIAPGNSGGPLLSLSGELLGINTFYMPESTAASFAIAADLVQAKARELRQGQTTLAPTPPPAGGGTLPELCGELASGDIRWEQAEITAAGHLRVRGATLYGATIHRPEREPDGSPLFYPAFLLGDLEHGFTAHLWPPEVRERVAPDEINLIATPGAYHLTEDATAFDLTFPLPAPYLTPGRQLVVDVFGTSLRPNAPPNELNLLDSRCVADNRPANP